jgi:hypothetical protein
MVYGVFPVVAVTVSLISCKFNPTYTFVSSKLIEDIALHEFESTEHEEVRGTVASWQ